MRRQQISTNFLNILGVHYLTFEWIDKLEDSERRNTCTILCKGKINRN